MLKRTHVLLAVTLAFTVASLMSGCSSAPTQNSDNGNPPWIDNPYADYPQNRYIVAVGTGVTLDQAAANGRRQLAESFRTQVVSNTQTNSNSSITSDTSGAAGGSATNQFSRTTNFLTDIHLRDAEVKKNYTDLKGNSYALVVIDKLSARSSVMSDLMLQESKLDNALSNLEGSDHPVFSKLKDVQGILQNYEVLVGEASLLGVTSIDRASKFEARASTLQNQWMAKLSKTSVRVIAKSTPDRLVSQIESCLQDAGVKLALADATPTSQVTITYNDRPDYMSVSGWFKVKGELNADILSGGTRSRATASGEETALSKDQAIDQLQERLGNDLCQQLTQKF